MAEFDFAAVQRGLLVFVPGIPTRRRAEPRSYSALLERLRASFRDTGWRVEVYQHDFVVTSRKDLDEAVGDLATSIREWAGEISEDVETPEAIIIVGHSFGGVLARAAFVRDVGSDGSGVASSRRPWTRAVRRIVLLGSPNAGFRWNARGTPLLWRLAYPLVTLFGAFTIEKVSVGGYWITNLRLRWLETFRHLANPPRVVQVLGTHDGFVTREDILDARFMPDTIEVQIPGATHVGLVDLSQAANADDRYDQLESAIFGRRDEIVESPTPAKSAPTFFILHGIRDSAYKDWVQDLSDAMKGLPENFDAQPVCPDTGYFSAIEFALPGTRKRKIHEFLKLYGDAYANSDPDAFVFAGHSNGTYMMAQALDRVPAMRFKRIYLAGTVLPRNFDWQTLMERRQIGNYAPVGWIPGLVRNDRATRDVPVGILCSWLRGLGNRDVGTAGLTGFEFAPASILDGQRAYPGGHGAALVTRERLAAIAEFLTRAQGAPPPDESPRSGFLWLSRFVGNPVVGWVIVLLLLGAVASAIVGVATLLGAWWAAAIAIGFVLAIWVLLRTI